MNFIEAMRKMNNGEICKLNDLFYSEKSGAIFIFEDQHCTQLHPEQNITMGEVISDNWVVIDKNVHDNNGNLAEQQNELFCESISFDESDVKKCRDLIINDFKKLWDIKYDEHPAIDIINKHFGDLK